MTTSLETIRRLHAWKDGRPLPRGQVVNVHVTDDEDLLIVSFLRMGGESRPWGVAIGTLAEGPSFFTVPEGRNRTLVADMMVEVAKILLEHFNHPSYSEIGPVESSESFRQAWLPGPTHVEMLQCLAAAYARSRWQRTDIDVLRALGNLCNALFIEHQRPGQQTVVSATEALRTCFVFPTAGIRQGHLGHLIGWLSPARGRNARLEIAHAAELESVATVLNPDYERETLQPLVEQWGQAQRKNDTTQMSRAAKKIASELENELRKRWDATARAARYIAEDPRHYNEGLTALVTDSQKQMFRTWGESALREEAGDPPYWPNVFSDTNARTAGRAYQKRIAFDQKARHLLVHGDTELQREELAAGHGVICTVNSIDNRNKRWIVKWSYPDLPTLKDGDGLVIAGAQKFTFSVDDVDLDTRTLVLTPKWRTEGTAGKRPLYAPSDERWRGRELVLLDNDAHGLAERKATTTGKVFGDDDITLLLGYTQLRHGAYDDDGRIDGELADGNDA